ncbi:MAG TPA: DeoR/GlpR family DNA-binding transcription regulator [Anaerovoracaceae bacterium]|nr:DeoR/GlpR family DNA-binding transcription regulator [Anaerovoracaceae bacterium]
MFMEERKQQILDILKKSKGAVSVKELCETLYASGATVRRDLADLEKNKLIRRTHGGAMLSDDSTEDPLIFREMNSYAQKQTIAKMASGYVSDGMILFIDSSTTSLAFAQTLHKFNNVKVITNGLKTALLLSEYPNVKVFCTGGTLKDNYKSLVGVAAREFISKYYADISFISCRGFSTAIGATDSSEEEYYIKKQYMENSNKVILLCDTSKFDTNYMCKLGPVSMFNEIITENKAVNMELAKLTKGI